MHLTTGRPVIPSSYEHRKMTFGRKSPSKDLSHFQYLACQRKMYWKAIMTDLGK